MSEASKLARLIAKLDALTGQSVLTWSIADPIGLELPHGDSVIGQVYECILEGQRFRLYKYSTRDWRDEDEFEWVERVNLDFMDVHDRTQYSTSDVAGTWGLLKTVQVKTHRIDETIDKILKL